MKYLLHHYGQALLQSEKEAAEEAKRVSVDAVAKIMDLARKLDKAEGKVDQLQSSARRYCHR